ncbi:hypothetical protein F5Y09DRAFT_355686 [Xylaria sp. FL1042]|nr:hypothetical protein F5Y09DRAFT_355686 [Xylaria sp. FL1042]
MSSESQEEVTITDVIVDTNNFHRVISLFDEAGDLVDPKTSFAIMCSICHNKHLALTNDQPDEKFDDTHEQYAVLPRCGHAFGSDCLLKWVHMADCRRHDIVPTCPTCRCPILCPKGHLSHTFALGSTSAEPFRQSEDLRAVRTALSTGSCAQCTELLPAEPEPADVLTEARDESQVLRTRIHGRVLDLHAALREGDRVIYEARHTWIQANSTLSRLQRLIQSLIECYHSDAEGEEIRNISLGITEDIERERSSANRYNADAWERIRASTARAQELATDRLTQPIQDIRLAAEIEEEIMRLHDLIIPRYFS